MTQQYWFDDKVGLVSAFMREPRPVGSRDEALRALQQADVPLSIAGYRCSQGGQTLLPGGRMLSTETYSRAIDVSMGDYDPKNHKKPLANPPTVTVAAGTLWSQLHHVLNPRGLAPFVHQSSCHFSVGGSISVNCHGRDPREGPIGNRVNWLNVLLPSGDIVKTSRQQEPELFKAVVGGYGTCGMILEANLQLTPNLRLEQKGIVVKSVGAYAKILRDVASGAKPLVHMHYGWLKCTSSDRLYDDVLSVDYNYVDMPQANANEPLAFEGWGDTEIMRAGWAAARKNDMRLREDIWQLVVDEIGFAGGNQAGRLNWMRAAVGFTAYRGKTDQDLLQEYFVPLARFESMIGALKGILGKAMKDGLLTVLSTTIRHVRQDDIPANLSYAVQGPRVCIAVDLNVPLDGQRKPTAGTQAVIDACLDACAANQGTYYLPYYPFASKARFEQFYGVQAARQRQAIARYNPGLKFDNVFRKTYLDA